MATQSLFSSVQDALKNLPLPPLSVPAWAQDEAERRLVLLLNHVLAQEPEATQRLVRQKGRVVQLRWRSHSLCLLATPAGLLDRAAPEAKPELVLTVSEESIVALAQASLAGVKPAVRIEGDVQLAAEVNWLVDHVRWDAEEALSRIIGDAPAHALAQAARRVAQALRQFVATVTTRKSA